MNQLRITILSVALIFVGNTMAEAQDDARSGIKGGLNLSNLYIDDVEDENVRAGFHAGIYTQLLLAPGFAIQPELLYATKGAKADYNLAGIQGESKFNLNYIDLPVLLTFKLGDAADIHIGPYISYLLGVNTSTDGDLGSSRTELDRDDYEKWDYGLAGGLALNFNPVTIGVRYNYGLNEIADSGEAITQIGDAKNSVAQIFIAFDMGAE